MNPQHLLKRVAELQLKVESLEKRVIALEARRVGRPPKEKESDGSE